MRSKISLKITLLLGLAAFVLFGFYYLNSPSQQSDSDWPLVTVYKNAGCGCCNDWITHLKQNGFDVKAHNVDNMSRYKDQAKLGPGMGSCHTAFVDGYAIEGHVPAQDIKRLLTQRPDVSGLTVPAMPIGTPGMEIAGQPAQAYQVISYKDGEVVNVFSDYPAEQPNKH